MSAHPAEHRAATMCRVLEVSAAGSYAWLKRPTSKRVQEDAVLLRQSRTVHLASRESYGVARVYRALRAQGIAVAEIGWPG